MDGQYRFGNNARLEFHAVASRSQDSSAGPVSDGYTISTMYEKDDRDLRYGAGFADVSEDFRTDVGYSTRTGIRSLMVYLQPIFYQLSGDIDRIQLSFTSFNSLDKTSGLWEMGQTLRANVLHLKRLTFSLNGSYATEIFLGRRYPKSSYRASWGGQLTNWLRASVSFTAGRDIYYEAPKYGLLPFSGNAQRTTASITFQPYQNLAMVYSLTYAQFRGDTTSAFDYSYPINRIRLTYQINQYIFLRWISEYNVYRNRLPTDLLASFTYIPGTVLHVGYGMIHRRLRWNPTPATYEESDDFLRTNTGFFFKASYLWRL